jgi:hypothetical protein
MGSCWGAAGAAQGVLQWEVLGEAEAGVAGGMLRRDKLGGCCHRERWVGKLPCRVAAGAGEGS